MAFPLSTLCMVCQVHPPLPSHRASVPVTVQTVKTLGVSAMRLSPAGMVAVAPSVMVEYVIAVNFPPHTHCDSAGT